MGDGAWGIETTGHDNGYSITDLAPFVDFVGPHVYRMESDVIRQHLKAALVCEMAAVSGQPVVMEEFGLSSDFVSGSNAGQLLPPAAAQHAAGGLHRLDRVEQHGL